MVWRRIVHVVAAAALIVPVAGTAAQGAVTRSSVTSELDVSTGPQDSLRVAVSVVWRIPTVPGNSEQHDLGRR